MTKIQMLAVTAAVYVGTALIGTASHAAPGTYFTHVDNASNANVPGTNTNTVPDNDMATGSLLTEPAPGITFGRTDPEAPIEFNIDVTVLPVNSASLTIRAYDVDEEDGEQDDVYLNGHLLGRLTGANNVWSTTVLSISDLSWLVADNNLVQIQIDTSGDSTNWVAAARWGQLLADGGAADRANTGSVVITGCVTRTATAAGCSVSNAVAAGTVRIDTEATVNVVTAGNYRLEVTIIDPAGNSSSVLTDSFSATAGSTDPHGLADLRPERRHRHVHRAVAALLHRWQQFPGAAGHRDRDLPAHRRCGSDRPRR
ncbi:MAG: hypothetical protein IPK65_07970 [Gammaproteobacteria bacterium]|nr:hypothetical protein [Gammaproteobacteria bacterium]